MSEYYQHYLIPVTPEFRPDADLVSNFLREIIEAGYVSDGYSLSCSTVTKNDSPSRVITNPFTGETITVKDFSRQLGKAQPLKSIELLTESAEEYDVTVSGEGLQPRPPLNIGYVLNKSWALMEEPFHHEIKCRVRSHIVRLSQLRSEGDLHRPLDLTNPPPPVFDEDCGADESEGIFVIPETGPVRIANAGCGMFWIEFNFGKFIFPKSRDGEVDLLDDGIVNQAKSTFGADFVQACSWG